MSGALKYSIFALLAVGLGVAIAYTAEKYGYIDDKLTKICEAKILSNLKSPRSYVRIKVISNEKIMTRDNYNKYMQESVEWEWKYLIIASKNYDYSKISAEFKKRIDEKLIEFDARPSAPIFIEKQFEYDSQNEFGAMLKGYATCDYIKYAEHENEYDDLRVRIDRENLLSKSYRQLVELSLVKRK